MRSDFHDSSFDQGTELKLEILKEYYRSWVPTFISPEKLYVNELHVFDYFSGPGKDKEGKSGSALILVEELANTYSELVVKAAAAGLKITVHLSDASQRKIDELRTNLAKFPDLPFSVITKAEPFEELFWKDLGIFRNPRAATFIFIDQCGISMVNKKVFQEIVRSKRTDLLFFISSDFAYRFRALPCINEKISIESFGMGGHNDAHRSVLEHYRSLIPHGQSYHLAPFSIKKPNNNIYGLIFGTNNLRALQKFLTVCWNKDRVTGEANYNIDQDCLRDGVRSLFPEDNVIKKIDRFEKNLLRFIKEESPTNQNLYVFTLTEGFLPKHTNRFLRPYLKDNRIVVVAPPGARSNIRKNTLYLTYNSFVRNEPRIRFVWRGDSDGDIPY